MNIKYIIGNYINLILLKFIAKKPNALPFIPNGRFMELDIKRAKEDIDIIFDVGANIGQTVINYGKIFPKATMYSFEPVKKTFDTLSNQLINNPKLHPINLALGDKTGKVNIFLYENSEFNSLNNQSANQHDLTEEIEVDTGQNFCRKNNITKVDILKIDTEGYELNVLKGFSRQFLAERIKFIYCETGFDKDAPFKTHFSDLENYLSNCGFVTTSFYEPARYGKTKLMLGFCNVLFTNKNIIDLQL